MKILVCAKIVYSFEDVLPEDWENWGGETLDLRYVKRVYSCFDEAALETALRLRDQLEASGRSAKLWAVSAAAEAGGDEALLKQLYAVGFDRVTQLAAGRDLSDAPEQAAALLCEYIRAAGDFDLIICGERADPGNWGQTGIRIAHALGIPGYAGVSNVDYDGYLQITRTVDRFSHVITAQTPMVLTIGNTVAANLRLPTLRQKLAAKSRVIEAGGPQENGLPGGTNGDGMDSGPQNHLRVSAFYQDKKEKRCQWIEGETVAEKAKVIRALMTMEGESE